MYALSFLIVELETARTALLDVFEVSNGTPNWTWHGSHFRMGCAAGLASHLGHYFGRPISKIEDKVRPERDRRRAQLLSLSALTWTP